jgi:hypothetical protein
MAITLAEQHALASDGDFINRVRQSMAAKAVDVLQEDPTGLVAGEYNARKRLAQRIVNDANAVAKNAAFILATHNGVNTTDPEAIPDSAYTTVIGNLWNVLAGFNVLDPDEIV